MRNPIVHLSSAVLLVATIVLTTLATPVGASPSLSPAIAYDIAHVPASAFNAVSASTSAALPLATKSQPALNLGSSKTTILYVGADYCPYCAAERWSLALALARFGSFSKLGATSSYAHDIYPSTPTLSFYGSTYTSTYIDFVPVELYTNKVNKTNTNYQVLQHLTKAEAKVQKTYDSSKYFPGVSTASPPIPFIDIDNHYLIVGSSFSPQLLSGLTRNEIAASLAKPTTPAAKAIVATANYIDAAICKSAPSTPKAVCASPAVKAASRALKK
jgi:thiol-disulfide isomerase/thioredoxin